MSDKDIMKNEVKRIAEALGKFLDCELLAGDVSASEKIDSEEYVYYPLFLDKKEGVTVSIDFYFNTKEPHRISRIHFYSSIECQSPCILLVDRGYDEALANDMKMMLDGIQGKPPVNGFFLGEEIVYEIDDSIRKTAEAICDALGYMD